jgi:enoyl-CoA hydratase/carnithine racemase
MTPDIQITKTGAVLELYFNRPQKKNAITSAMYDALAQAFQDAESDAEIRVILLAGTPGAFTAGNDLGDFLNSAPRQGDSAGMKFLRALAQSTRVMVAAVDGVAIGIGTTMLLHFDLIVAGKGARFQLPFVDLALVPEAASTLLLPRITGHQRAAELLLLGEPFDAERAYELGIVNRVVDEGQALLVAQELVARLVGKPPAALALTKKLLRDTTGTVMERITAEGVHFGAQLQSEEAKEVFRRFLNKAKA